MINIIMSVYNNVSVAREAIYSVLKNTDILHKFILVNNHSFDIETQSLLKELSAKFKDTSTFQVVDPGRNLGCHDGWNFGFKFINPSFSFCSKIDDDTMVPKNWASNLVSAAETWEKSTSKSLGMLSANLDCRTSFSPEILDFGSFQYEIPKTAPSFSCVLFKTKVIQTYGLMKGYGLYGHEESYYFKLFKEKGLSVLWSKNVLVHHIEANFKNWDYIVWKYFYGFRKKTTLSFDNFIESPDFQKAWFSLVEYYLSTDRSKLRKDEDPALAVQAFSTRVQMKNWAIPVNLQNLIQKFHLLM